MKFPFRMWYMGIVAFQQLGFSPPKLDIKFIRKTIPACHITQYM